MRADSKPSKCRSPASLLCRLSRVPGVGFRVMLEGCYLSGSCVQLNFPCWLSWVSGLGLISGKGYSFRFSFRPLQPFLKVGAWAAPPALPFIGCSYYSIQPTHKWGCVRILSILDILSILGFGEGWKCPILGRKKFFMLLFTPHFAVVHPHFLLFALLHFRFRPIRKER